jgi:hypothetical protein
MTNDRRRYWVTQDLNSKGIGVFRVEEIAALLNANHIQEDYLGHECSVGGPSYAQLTKSADAKWLSVSQILASAYSDRPLISVIVQTVETNTIVLAENCRSDDGPWQVGLRMMTDYFDRNLQDLAKRGLEDFAVYFASDRCPPTKVIVKLKLGNRTVYKGVSGSKQEPWEETYPYTCEESKPRSVESPDKFPSSALGPKPPKYDPTAPLPPGFH